MTLLERGLAYARGESPGDLPSDGEPSEADRDWHARQHLDSEGITEREEDRLSIEWWTVSAAEYQDALAERYRQDPSAAEIMEASAGSGHGCGPEWEPEDGGCS